MTSCAIGVAVEVGSGVGVFVAVEVAVGVAIGAGVFVAVGLIAGVEVDLRVAIVLGDGAEVQALTNTIKAIKSRLGFLIPLACFDGLVPPNGILCGFFFCINLAPASPSL